MAISTAMHPLLLLALAMAPPAELKPITSLEAIEVVVHEGEWSISWQDEHVLGQFLVWRDEKWRGMDWGGCGAGVIKREIGPGTWPSQPIYPLHRERFGPGRYRYTVRLTSTSSKEERVVTRAFSILPASDDELRPLREAMVERMARGCSEDRDRHVRLLSERASTTQLRAMFEDPRMTLTARRQLVLFVSDPGLTAALPELLQAKNADVALAAAVLLHEREGDHEDTIVAGIERGEDVVDTLRYGRQLLPTDLADRLVVVLERTTNARSAMRLASVLSSRQLTLAQNDRGAAHLDKLAAMATDATLQARLRIAAQAWRAGHSVDGNFGCCGTAPENVTCGPPTALEEAAQALREKSNVVDEGAITIEP